MCQYRYFTLLTLFYMLIFYSYLPDVISHSSDKYVDQIVRTNTSLILYAQNNEEEKQITSNSQNVSNSNEANSAVEQVQPEKSADMKEIESDKPLALQYCSGKYKKLGDSGYEIITVSCPDVTSKCECEIDMKNFTEYINCGGARKSASKGSEIRECESIIVGN